MKTYYVTFYNPGGTEIVTRRYDVTSLAELMEELPAAMHRFRQRCTTARIYTEDLVRCVKLFKIDQ